MKVEGKDATPARQAASWIEVDEAGEGQRTRQLPVRRPQGVPKSHVYRNLRSGEVP